MLPLQQLPEIIEPPTDDSDYIYECMSRGMSTSPEPGAAYNGNGEYSLSPSLYAMEASPSAPRFRHLRPPSQVLSTETDDIIRKAIEEECDVIAEIEEGLRWIDAGIINEEKRFVLAFRSQKTKRCYYTRSKDLVAEGKPCLNVFRGIKPYATAMNKNNQTAFGFRCQELFGRKYKDDRNNSNHHLFTIKYLLTEGLCYVNRAGHLRFRGM